jgi:hypothetical protein
VSDVVNSSERKQKVVVLREQERVAIYTTKMSKQVAKGHVRDAVHMYLVNWGAELTLRCRADILYVQHANYYQKQHVVNF